MFTPDNLDVLIVSFEGPDRYSQAGGLGVRVRDMACAVAALGHRTTLAFLGDPDAPEDELWEGVRLLRRSRELCRRFPAGVYQGEEEKILDVCRVLPGDLAELVIAPAVAQGRVVAVLTEEWQLAGFCRLLHRRLEADGLRRRCVLLWNANNHFGFEDIDWEVLGGSAGITTVSRYMKHIMAGHGVNPVVIPNGIAVSALDPPDPAAVRAIAEAAGTACLAFKIGRFSPDKGWHQALEALAELRREGVPCRLLMRGDSSAFGSRVLAEAAALGLSVAPWDEPVAGAGDIARALAMSAGADVVDLRRFLPLDVIPQIAAAATAVLANSGHEPFGLVGLEAMAAGGVAVVGATGEEYARPYGNAIVVDTPDGAEVASALRGLIERPALSARLRQAARRDAADYAWPVVLEGLLERLRYLSLQQGVALPPGGDHAPRIIG